MLKHSQQGLITSQWEEERGETATTEGKKGGGGGGVTKQARGDEKAERRRGREREMKMRPDRREADGLRDRSSLSRYFDLDLCGPASRCMIPRGAGSQVAK